MYVLHDPCGRIQGGERGPYNINTFWLLHAFFAILAILDVSAIPKSQGLIRTEIILNSSQI